MIFLFGSCMAVADLLNIKYKNGCSIGNYANVQMNMQICKKAALILQAGSFKC